MKFDFNMLVFMLIIVIKKFFVVFIFGDESFDILILVEVNKLVFVVWDYV